MTPDTSADPRDRFPWGWLPASGETAAVAAALLAGWASHASVGSRLSGTLSTPAGDALAAAAVAVVLVVRHRWVAAAREARRELQAMFEAAPTAIFTTAEDGTVRAWTAAAERTFGWPAADVVGRPLPIFPPDGAAAAASRARVWAGHAIADQVAEAVRRDGTRLDLSLSAAPLRDAAGRVIASLFLATDVTARLAAERAVAAGDARFARMTANLPGVVFQYLLRPGAKAVYTYVSDGAEETFGLPADAVRADAQALVRIIVPDDAVSFRTSAAASRATLAAWHWEGRVVHARTGAVRWISAAARPERQPDGSTVWDGVMSDVTAHKAARDAAEAASRAKSEFLANMSHELRTPLNGVIGMAELLLGTPLAGDQLRFARVLRSSGDALLGVINQVLDFSKIEAGKLDLETVLFDPRELSAGVVDMLAVKASEKGLAVRLDAAPDLPARVTGDPTRVRQVLVNLINNAIKFTDRGHVAVAVTVDAPHETADAPHEALGGTQTTLRFAVTDTGPGVPADRLDRLFKSFSQVDASDARRHGGTGLGLAISARLADLMGGQTGVRSTVGVGSTFWFTARLPAAPYDAAAPTAAPVAAPVATPTADATNAATDGPGRLSVLVAEDNDVNQMVVGEMLRRMGHAVAFADDGAQAVAAVAAGRYDLVLMDCQMPGMDGFAATAAIRAAERIGPAAVDPTPTTPPAARRLPVIALTANAVAGDRDRCLSAGMDDYLTKPLDPRALAAKLAAWSPARRAA